MGLESDLYEYKKLTLELLEKVSVQGNRLYLLKKREEILEKICEANYDIDSLRIRAKELELLELDVKLKKSVDKEMNKIKQQIINLKRGSQGNSAYITAGYGKYALPIFDKKY